MLDLRASMLRFWASLRRSRPDARLDAELQYHQAMLEAERCAAGLEARQARRAAALALGGRDQIREACHDQRVLPWLDDLRRDLALGFRALRKAPGFSAIGVLSLALGIGANTAIFSLLDAALLQKLPVRDPDRLALLYWHAHQWPLGLDQSGEGGLDVDDADSYSLAYPTFERLRDQSHAIASSVFGFAPLGLGGPSTAVMAGGQTSLARGELVTGEFFSGLGVSAFRGRAITPADEQPGAPLVAVISYGYWTRRFARDPGVVGQPLSIDGNPATLVGVAPPGFEGVHRGGSCDLWVAMSPTLPAGITPWGYIPPNVSAFHATGYWWLEVMARLRPGVGRARVAATWGPVFHQLAEDGLNPAPKGDAVPELGVAAGAQGINNFGVSYGRTLWILMAVVGMLLLLACGNVAALLLARATARRQEIAVRLALGARRGRLVRQMLTESVLLACIGGALGAALAPLGTRMLLALLGGSGPLAVAVPVDGAVMAFAVVVSVSTGILFGLAPAFRCTGVEIAAVVKSGRAVTDGRRVRLMGDQALVVAQVALSMMLLVSAGLFLRTFTQLRRQPLGFNPDRLLGFNLDGTQAGYRGAGLAQLYRSVRERVTAVPGVEAATASRLGLLTGWVSNGTVDVPGLKLSPSAARADKNGVGADFFAVMGIPIRLGRGFDERDLASTRRVAVINATLARHLFGDAYPLGYQIGNGNRPGPDTHEIVGVAADARYDGVRGDMPPTLYYPYTQMPVPLGGLVFEVRFRGDAQAVVPGIRSAIHQLDPALAMSEVKTQLDVDGEQMAQQRMFAQLSAFFSLLGLTLACIGLEGTMAYAVTRRTGEIGIRMAPGARRGQVLGAVLRETLSMTLIGIAAGSLGALAATRYIAGQLYAVRPGDPFTLAAAAVLMLAVAALAGWRPAYRAACVDPITALRAE